MTIELNYDQRAQLELMSMHAGKSPEQLLLDAASFVMERDQSFWENVMRPEESQRFLEADELDVRFAQMLRR